MFENVTCVYEKNVYFIAILWNVLCMSVIVQVEFFFYWMIIFLDDQTIVESVMLKSPILVVLLATSSQLC